MCPVSPTPWSVRYLNESPSEKEGKCAFLPRRRGSRLYLNESPSEKEGKFWRPVSVWVKNVNLNESPSEKEGKSVCFWAP